MTTSGGGWTLALAYNHPAGGVAPLVSGTAPLDPIGGYSQFSASQLAAFPFSEARFYCQTSLHARRIHVIFAAPAAISYLKATGANAVSNWTSFSALPDHSANLPAATSAADSTATPDWHMDEQPFFVPYTYHWNILPGVVGPTGDNRFECDDYAGGPAYATLHQIWVR
jgi:hypothetical protein